MKLKSLRRLSSISALLLATAFITSGCDSWINDEEGDCSVHYKVLFSYTNNMSGGDAFANQVKALTLYVVDRNGNIVTSKSESGDALSRPGYTMDVEVRPGTYDLLVWAQGESPVATHTDFTIGTGTQASAITATLPLQGQASDLTEDKDITPLFHGYLANVSFPDTYGNVDVATVNLTKDTNQFMVLLQSIDGSEITPDEFAFSISADNSELNYLNAVTSTTSFSYTPWSVTQTSASYDKPFSAPASRATLQSNGLLAELTVGRLTVDRRPKLIVHRLIDNSVMIRIDLIEYLLMVKGEYRRNLSDQQYLDYQDFFTLMFFLDVDHRLYTQGGIFINGWRVVPPQGSVL